MVARTNYPPVRPAVQEQARIAMPIGGLNYVNNFMDFPKTDAYLLDNFIPKTNGIEIRKGWARWIKKEDKFIGEVRTLLVFNGDKPADSKLFVSPAADGKIYDITTPEMPPVPVMIPETNSLRLGEWYDTHYHTEAGNFLCVVSAGAGYFTYSAAGWIDRSASLTFPPVGGSPSTLTAKDIAFIWSWKNRLWFLVKDSLVAYYLPVTAIQGTLAAFDFGQQLTRGGALAFGSTWTYDAGNGIDDSLVIASNQGELLIYQGTDPASAANFQLKGLWYIGEVPTGRRGFCQHGGDLLILCGYGMVSMADVISGKLSESNLAGGPGIKVNQALQTRISNNLDKYYWSLTIYPKEALLVVSTPIYLSELGTYQTLGMNSINNAWCTFTGMDILCTAVWQNKFIFGTRDGMVGWGFKGNQDDVDIAELEDGFDITGRFQNCFDDFESPNMNKRVLRIKLYGLLERTEPTFHARFQPEYTLSDDIYAPALNTGPLPYWDVALWDQNTWAAGAASFHTWYGVNGFGKKLSLQCAMRGSGRILATDYEVLYEIGRGL